MIVPRSIPLRSKQKTKTCSEQMDACKFDFDRNNDLRDPKFPHAPVKRRRLNTSSSSSSAAAAIHKIIAPAGTCRLVDSDCFHEHHTNRIGTESIHKIHQGIHNKRKLPIKDENDPKISFHVIENVQDIFVHILRNFIADSGLVDGQSIRSVMLVCKSWKVAASSTVLWSVAAKGSTNINIDLKGAILESKNSDYAKILSANKHGKITEISSSQKICGILHIQKRKLSMDFFGDRSLHSELAVKTVISSKIHDKLIAFAKLGTHSIGSEGICFKARERATGKLFSIKAPWNFDFERSDYHSNDEEGKSQPSSALREIAALQRLMGPNFFSTDKQNNPKNISEHICLPHGISLINGHLLRWYEFIEYSLDDFIQHNSGKSNDISQGMPLSSPVVKKWIHQILKGINFLHQKGVIHRNLKPKHLLLKNITCLDSGVEETKHFDHFSQATIQIADFTLVRVNSFPKRSFTPKVVSLWYRPPEILLGNNAYTTAIDMWSIGCIFAEIARGNALFSGSSEIDQMAKILESIGSPHACFGDEEIKTANSNTLWLKVNVPGLCDQGIDLLSKLLEIDPEKRITAIDALSHSYFNEVNMDSSITKQCQTHLDETTKTTANCCNGSKIKSEYSSRSISKELINIESSIREMSIPSSLLPCPQQRGISGTNKGKKNLIRIDQWAKLVDWMIEIVDVFDKHPRTAFLAMDYFHKFIASVKVPKSQHYQLIAATCLHIASKCEDVNCIGLTDLVFSADNTFRGEDIIFLEKKILTQIHWRLSDPVLFDFVSSYVDYMEETFVSMNVSIAKAYWMVQYISELALQCNVSLCIYEPSLIGACVISLCLQWLGSGNQENSNNSRNNFDNLRNIWPKRLEEVSMYELKSDKKIIQDCTKALLLNITHVKTTLPELKVISKRFRKSERGRVSDLPLPGISRFEAII